MTYERLLEIEKVFWRSQLALIQAPQTKRIQNIDSK